MGGRLPAFILPSSYVSVRAELWGIFNGEFFSLEQVRELQAQPVPLESPGAAASPQPRSPQCCRAGLRGAGAEPLTVLRLAALSRLGTGLWAAQFHWERSTGPQGLGVPCYACDLIPHPTASYFLHPTSSCIPQHPVSHSILYPASHIIPYPPSHLIPPPASSYTLHPASFRIPPHPISSIPPHPTPHLTPYPASHPQPGLPPPHPTACYPGEPQARCRARPQPQPPPCPAPPIPPHPHAPTGGSP